MPLQEIEKAHHKLLKTLREPSVNQESEDQQCPSATVSRTPSLDRGSGDGKAELNLLCKDSQNSSWWCSFRLFSKPNNIFVFLNQTRQRGQSSRAQDSVDRILSGFTCKSLDLDSDALTWTHCQTWAPQPSLPSSLHAQARGTEPGKDHGRFLFLFLFLFLIILCRMDSTGSVWSAQALTCTGAQGSQGRSEGGTYEGTKRQKETGCLATRKEKLEELKV